MYPGEIQGVWGAVGSFPLMPAEMILSLGIVCMLGFLFVMGLKYLELLPPKEIEEIAAPTEGPAAEIEAKAEPEPVEEPEEKAESEG